MAANMNTITIISVIFWLLWVGLTIYISYISTNKGKDISLLLLDSVLISIATIFTVIRI